MAEEERDEKFDFTREGEVFGYIYLDQARVLAMRTARESPGAYGRRSLDVPMAFEVAEALQLSESEFLEYASQSPSQPLNMTSIMATNRGEAGFPWPQVAHDGAVASVGAVEAAAWIQERQAFVLDVRDPWEYAAGRIPGAVSLPQADLALRLEEVPKDRDVLVVCASGNRSLRAAGFLTAVGHTRVTDLDGGTTGWIGAGNSVEKDS